MIQSTTELIDEVRLLYNQFMELLDELHRNVGVTPSQRAVLEHLQRGGITVPSLARERGVTRQHIQSVVNDLVDLGLAEARDNPAHKRSPLIGLTREGDRVIAAAIAQWREVVGDKLRAVAAVHPPAREVDFDSLADMLTALFEGAFVLARSAPGRRVFADQLRHYRTYLQLLFGA